MRVAAEFKEKLDMVRAHRSSRGLGDDELEVLAEMAEVEEFQVGDLIHPADKKVDAIYLINRGSVRLSVRLDAGIEKPVLYMGKDEQFGLFALTQDEPPMMDVIAEEPCLVLRYPREEAEELLIELPLWRHNLLQALGPAIRQSCLGIKRHRKRRVITMVHFDEKTRSLSRELLRRLVELNEEVGLISDRDTPESHSPDRFMMIDAGKADMRSSLRNQVGRWHSADRIVFDLTYGPFESDLLELLSGSEEVYWFVTTEQAEYAGEKLRHLADSISGIEKRFVIVRALRRDEPVCPTDALAELARRDYKIHVDGNEHGAFVADRRSGIERIIHELRSSSIGLALGGGAARGMAHLGVLAVLEQAGIVVDRFAGTSAGSLVGVPYASGLPVEYLTRSFGSDLTPGWIYRWLPRGDAFYMLRQFRTGNWDGMLRKYLHQWRLDQFPVPFSTVAVDLVLAEQVIRRDFDAVHAILESINLPGISRPICYDGKAMMDGGVLNVVPADVLVAQDADFVIASDVASRISLEFAGNRPDTPTSQMKRPSSMAGVVRTRMVQDRNIRSMGGRAADIVIEPDVSSVELTDFQHAAAIADIGRVAASESLPSLKTKLNELDPELYPLS